MHESFRTDDFNRMRCDLFLWCLHRMLPSNFVVRRPVGKALPQAQTTTTAFHLVFFFIQWIDATLFLHITFLLCNFSFPICIIHGYFLLQFSLFTFLFGLADHFIATNICFLFNWNSFQLIFANRCILCLNF